MQAEQTVLNGRYKLLERAGSGGMAVVYKAQDLVLRRLVAVKLLQESLTSDEEFLRRFQQEAHAAANLAHPNIVTVHDVGQDGRRHFIVMEFVDGRTLKQVIRDQAKSGRPLPLNRVLDLTIQVCEGIGYAHRAGLVHCDVKPQNVLVTRDDRVKVTDFGIARAMSQISQPVNDLVWGTPQYFSPEQAAGRPATPASDVYAIGLILFELLTGRPPFAAESHTALALKHLNEPPPPVSQFNPVVPPQLERILQKVLVKEPAGRYRTADQLGRILAAYRQSSQEDTGEFVLASGQLTTPIAEQRTMYFGQDTPQRPTRAVRAAEPTIYRPATGRLSPPAGDRPDWTAVTLGLVALVALLGLIPLWYFVYRAWLG